MSEGQNKSAGDKGKLVDYLKKLDAVCVPKISNEKAKQQLLIVTICIRKCLEFAEKIK